MTAAILSPFQALVKDFKYRLPLQKADRMVGLNPIMADLHNSVMADQEAG